MPWPAETLIDFAGAGDNIVIPGVPGAVVRVWQIFLVAAASTVITIQSGSTPLTGPMTIVTMTLDFVQGSRQADQPWFLTEVGEAFVISQVAGVQVSGRLYYTQGEP